jgi:hypothetical protein
MNFEKIKEKIKPKPEISNKTLICFIIFFFMIGVLYGSKWQCEKLDGDWVIDGNIGICRDIDWDLINRWQDIVMIGETPDFNLSKFNISWEAENGS